MKIIIANRNNIAEIIEQQQEPFAVIAISNPYPEPLNYNTRSNLYKGMLKLEFYDCDEKAMSDERLRYNSGHHRALLAFVDAMISIGVCNIIAHCDKGLHRSVAAAEIIRRVYLAKGMDVEIVNLPESFEPNQFMLSFLNGEELTN